MDPVTEHLQHLLLRDVKAFRAELDAFPEEALLWRTLPGITNPAGTLALHVAGNLQHFVGALLGGTGYTRNRELEFSQRTASRDSLQSELAKAMDVVAAVLPRLEPEVLDREFPVEVEGGTVSARVFLLRLSAHLAYHLGQLNYLRRTLLQG